MAGFNGAGVFSRVHNFVQDRINGLKIQAQRVDDEMDGLAAGLSNCITRDGQSTVAADIPWNGKRLTGLGNATADGDALNRGTADARYQRLGAVSARTTSFGLAAADIGTVQRCAPTATGGAIVCTLPASGALAAGWSARVVNDGTASVVLTPQGVDTIDGGAAGVAVRLKARQSCLLYFDGAGFRTEGRGRAVVLASVTVTSPAAAIDFTLPADYEAFRLVFEGITTAAADGYVGLRASGNAGATFAAGATDYTRHNGGASTRGDFIYVTGSINGGGGASGETLIHPGLGGVAGLRAQTRCWYYNSSGWVQGYFNGGSSIVANSVRLVAIGSNIATGRFNLVGEA